MEKKWLLRLPRDLDDWLTLKAAEETVNRGRRVSKNTLIIELATRSKDESIPEPSTSTDKGTVWRDVKSALEYIQEAMEKRDDVPSSASERLKQRLSVNLKLLESYLEELEE